MCGTGIAPVGALTGGVVGSIAGLPTVFFTSVALCLLAAGPLMRYMPDALTRELGHRVWAGDDRVGRGSEARKLRSPRPGR